MDAIGGTINAFASRDFTCYHATVQAEYTFHALDLLGDVLLNPIFPEEQLERENNCVGARNRRCGGSTAGACARAFI